MKKVSFVLVFVIFLSFFVYAVEMTNDILVIDFSPSTTNLLYDLQGVIITNNSLVLASSYSSFKITTIRIDTNKGEVFKNLYINVDLTPSTVLEMSILDARKRVVLYKDLLTSSTRNYFYDLEKILPKRTGEIYFIFTSTTSAPMGGRVNLITLTKEVAIENYVGENEVKVYPNPVLTKLNQIPKIVINLPKESYVNLVVFDSMGNVVRKFVDNKLMERGIHSFVWDLKNDRGVDVPSGKYVVFLSADNIPSTTMILVVR